MAIELTPEESEEITRIFRERLPGAKAAVQAMTDWLKERYPSAFERALRIGMGVLVRESQDIIEAARASEPATIVLTDLFTRFAGGAPIVVHINELNVLFGEIFVIGYAQACQDLVDERVAL